MKEKDIVDFTKFKVSEEDENEHIDENGNEVGCHICYTHEKAYQKLPVLGSEIGQTKDEDLAKRLVVQQINVPRCPKCGKPMYRRYSWTDMHGNAVVSEVNYSKPDGEIGYYSIWECSECKDSHDNEQIYALMPIPITWNANHDIYYTGGDRFVEDTDLGELVDLINEKVSKSVTQYVERREQGETNLKPWQVSCWATGDVQNAIAEWFYNHGYKK